MAARPATAAAWSDLGVTFRREGTMGTWHCWTDRRGERQDPRVPRHERVRLRHRWRLSGRPPGRERVLPLPFTNVASGVYTNSAGIFRARPARPPCRPVRQITDSCETTSKAADGSGVGSPSAADRHGLHDPVHGRRRQQTHAARTQFTTSTAPKEIGRLAAAVERLARQLADRQGRTSTRPATPTGTERRSTSSSRAAVAPTPVSCRASRSTKVGSWPRLERRQRLVGRQRHRR